MNDLSEKGHRFSESDGNGIPIREEGRLINKSRWVQGLA
jgi:hypothetical protein